MKIFRASVLLIIGLLLVPGVSARQAHECSVKINTEVVAKGGIKLKFIELVDDSRCPTDTNCIWAGNAKIKVRVTRNGRTKVLELNSNLEPRASTFAGYRFRLVGLTPEPRSNIRIDRNGYVAVIEVKKGK